MPAGRAQVVIGAGWPLRLVSFVCLQCYAIRPFCEAIAFTKVTMTNTIRVESDTDGGELTCPARLWDFVARFVSRLARCFSAAPV